MDPLRERAVAVLDQHYAKQEDELARLRGRVDNG